MSEQTEPSLGEINRRLAEIDAALDGPARAPSPEQYALLTERDYLRALASAYHTERDRDRSTSQLRAELESLERRLKSEVASRTGFVTSKGGGSHSPTPGAWIKLAAQARQGSLLSRLQGRIGEIDSELQRRASAD